MYLQCHFICCDGLVNQIETTVRVLFLTGLLASVQRKKSESKMSRQWDNSLFGCFSDCGTCCYGFWCTCCLAGSNAQRLEKAKGDPDADCCAHCCIWYILSCFCCQGCYECSTTRKDMRKRYNLEGDDASACLAHTFCAGELFLLVFFRINLKIMKIHGEQ